jgi:hypothetical protein
MSIKPGMKPLFSGFIDFDNLVLIILYSGSI